MTIAKKIRISRAALALAGAFAAASAQGVRINEFMADNDTLASPAGVKADWVELYNTTASPVNLSGMYLSDNANNPTKWQFPSGVSIPANGYLVVWAYDTTVSGSALFASWALSKDGEHIRLSTSGLDVVDSVTFGPQPKNRTMARIPNGTGAFASCLPTLGAANDCSGVTSLRGAPESGAGAFGLHRLAGGRFAARFTLESAAMARLSVLDARGREVAVPFEGRFGAGTHERSFDPGTLPAGMYGFRLRLGSVEHVRTALILR